MNNTSVFIGGASGFWGDSARATAQLLQDERLDFIVYDYLAEVTMSLLARARSKDDSKGYALSFLTEAMGPNLNTIAERGIKIVSNAGGVNAYACAEALKAIIAEQGLDLKVAWIEGDDLTGQKQSFVGVHEMFSGDDFPDPESVQSINAYLGAFPIAQALKQGADIVITGRCVDSAVTLGACIYQFNWTAEDLDWLAGASLAGHILECGAQATGGNFTDWQDVRDRHNIGYPVAEIANDGSFICDKPDGTGGLVSVGTVAEQLVYEIGDPSEYILPDVVCDFTAVEIKQLSADRVRVTGARGKPAPENYKVSATYSDQYRGGTYLSFYGFDADKRATALADAVLRASREALNFLGLPDFSETSIELIGAGSQFGQYRHSERCDELAMKIAVKHPDRLGVGVMLKQLAELALATPPGLSGFGGNSPKISPVVRLFSLLVPKSQVSIKLHFDDRSMAYDGSQAASSHSSSVIPLDAETIPRLAFEDSPQAKTTVPLIKLAWGRSGDKGNNANVGIIARRPEYLPYINATLTSDLVAARFSHFFTDGQGWVEKFHLPGIHAINFVLHDVLGGGGIASLRNDPQGKGYAQLLLACPIVVPTVLAEKLK